MEDGRVTQGLQGQAKAGDMGSGTVPCDMLNICRTDVFDQKKKKKKG